MILVLVPVPVVNLQARNKQPVANYSSKCHTMPQWTSEPLNQISRPFSYVDAAGPIWDLYGHGYGQGLVWIGQDVSQDEDRIAGVLLLRYAILGPQRANGVTAARRSARMHIG